MTVKEKVLLILEQNKNMPVSGQQLANEIGCSRAGIWKAVKELQKAGYRVEGVNNRGYTLQESPDSLSKAYIDKKLEENGVCLKTEVYELVDSTNALLWSRAREGCRDDIVAIAAEQTAGRGRKGRSFYSPSGSGVYLSLLLHPNVPVATAALLTTIAATAEAVAIEKVTGLETSIKWINDIWMRGKKISGILTEAATSIEDGLTDYVVVGVGINLYTPKEGFPDEIKDVAGAVFEDDVKRENFKNDLVSRFITEFMRFYKEFPNAAYIEEYKKRCFVIGKDVEILTSTHEKLQNDGPDRTHAHVLGVDDEAHLHVRYPDGTEEFLSSGEISVRLQ